MVGAIFIDLRKVFDTVEHVELLTKLKTYKIEGEELTSKTIYLIGPNASNLELLFENLKM